MKLLDTLSNLCLLKGESINQSFSTCGLSSSLVTNWKNGSQPNLKTLEALANYFNVSIDYLVGRETPANAPKTYTPLLQDIITECETLDTSGLHSVLSYAKFQGTLSKSEKKSDNKRG